jgi:hypothetical protein
LIGAAVAGTAIWIVILIRQRRPNSSSGDTPAGPSGSGSPPPAGP